jgi:glyoxylase-like metal-dependent hydrolase (beta-lactamase superfamily II)
MAQDAGEGRLRIACLPAGQLEANCYLIIDPGTSATLVVDPGAGADALLARLHALGGRVVSIVHTHGHFDHISATEAVLAGLGEPVPVAAHPADAYLYEPAARAKGALLGYAMPEAPLTPSVALQDGDEVAVGAQRLRVIHTPGHTPGGICLLAEGEFILTGDTLFRRGIGRFDLPGGDEDALYESILTRLYSLAPELVVYPGHGASTTIDEERRENPFVQA